MSSSDPVQSAENDLLTLPSGKVSSCSVPCLFLSVWLVMSVPLFLRMPETNDAEMFDLQAWMASSGGVLYRDILEPNLPGVVWIHLVVRAIAGSSSEVLRAWDLFSFALLMSFVFRLLKMAGGTARSAMWTVLGCSMFYLSTSEWCHCQRDMWMLTPAAAGVWLRLKQRKRVMSDCSAGRLILWGIVEGLVWGSGIWIKPHVLLVTIAVWLCTLSGRAVAIRRTALDALGLLGGGVLMGVAGVVWLQVTGAWPYLLDTMFNWNPGYLDAGRENWNYVRFKAMVIRFLPWFLLHVMAVPVSLKQVWRRLVRRSAASETPTPLVSSVLSVVYLIWMGHSFLLQHLFDYVHAPGVVLAIVVCADRLTRSASSTFSRSVAMLFGMIVIAMSPILQPQSLPLWRECVSRVRMPAELQDQLTHFGNPRRTDLQAITRYLKEQQVAGTDVLMFNSDAVSLYRRLDLKPPTRAVYFFEILVFFPDRRKDVIVKALGNKPRFIVLDLVSCLVMDSRAAHETGPAGIHAPPPAYQPRAGSFPWKYPVVFRSGSWLVLAVE